MSKIGFVANQGRYKNVFQSLKLVEKDFAEKFEQAETPLIKVNFVSNTNQLAATHVQAVKSTVDILNSIDKKEITVAEAAFSNTQKGFKNFGYQQLAQDYPNISLMDLNTAPVEEWNGFRLSKPILDSDFRINVSPPKTHDTVVITGAMKNFAVGAIIIGSKQRGSHSRSNFHQGNYAQINQRLVDLYQQVKPDLAILDGFKVMEGRGPSSGNPIKSNWALAGTNPVEVDAVAAYLMGFDPADIGYLYFAHQRGLGQINFSRIDLAGDDPKLHKKEIEAHPRFKQQLKWKKQN